MAGIRRQAEPPGLVIPRQKEGLQGAAGPIFNDGLPAGTPLDQEGQVAAVPTQGGGTVGLMPPQVPQGKHLAAAALLQQNGGAAAALDEGSQQTTITAQGRLLAVLSTVEADRTGRLPAQSASADGQQHASHHQCSGVQRPQSSKRELLSRGRGDPLVLPPGAGRTGRNSASLTPASASGLALA